MRFPLLEECIRCVWSSHCGGHQDPRLARNGASSLANGYEEDKSLIPFESTAEALAQANDEVGEGRVKHQPRVHLEEITNGKKILILQYLPSTEKTLNQRLMK